MLGLRGPEINLPVNLGDVAWVPLGGVGVELGGLDKGSKSRCGAQGGHKPRSLPSWLGTLSSILLSMTSLKRSQRIFGVVPSMPGYLLPGLLKDGSCTEFLRLQGSMLIGPGFCGRYGILVVHPAQNYPGSQTA